MFSPIPMEFPEKNNFDLWLPPEIKTDKPVDNTNNAPTELPRHNTTFEGDFFTSQTQVAAVNAANPVSGLSSNATSGLKPWTNEATQVNVEAYRAAQRQNLREIFVQQEFEPRNASHYISPQQQLLTKNPYTYQPTAPTMTFQRPNPAPTNFMQYLPQHQTQDFAHQLPSSPDASRLTQKQRINSWTYQEEAFLIGVVVAKYLYQGSLFGPECVVKKRKRDAESKNIENGQKTRKSKSSAIEDCWASVKEAFDTVWNNYTVKTGYARPCDRTSQALARHYKVMKTKLKSGKQNSFHSLYLSWRTEYDVNHSLLHPDFFAIQEYIKAKKDAADKNENRDESSLNSLLHADQYQRVNSWNPHEEIILVGIVVDRFIKRGSLVSPRRETSAKNGNNQGSEDTDNDCWSTIKRTYDVAWNRFTEVSGIQRPMERTVNALSRHYKVMRSRFLRNIKILMENGQDSIVANKEGRQNLTLTQVYDTWMNTYNANNILVNPNEH